MTSTKTLPAPAVLTTGPGRYQRFKDELRDLTQALAHFPDGQDTGWLYYPEGEHERSGTLFSDGIDYILGCMFNPEDVTANRKDLTVEAVDEATVKVTGRHQGTFRRLSPETSCFAAWVDTDTAVDALEWLDALPQVKRKQARVYALVAEQRPSLIQDWDLSTPHTFTKALCRSDTSAANALGHDQGTILDQATYTKALENVTSERLWNLLEALSTRVLNDDDLGMILGRGPLTKIIMRYCEAPVAQQDQLARLLVEEKSLSATEVLDAYQVSIEVGADAATARNVVHMFCRNVPYATGSYPSVWPMEKEVQALTHAHQDLDEVMLETLTTLWCDSDPNGRDVPELVNATERLHTT